MLIDSTSSTSLYSSYTSSSTSELGSTDFLTLLIAQLQYQDPLNPMEDTEMLSELAAFSSLEQLTAMNETLGTMASSLNASLVNSAVSFIGMDVWAEGDSITKGSDGVSSITYTLTDTATAASAYIYNTAGELVATVALTDLDAGEHSFTWDGTTSSGEEASTGSYTVSILRQDEGGDYYAVSTQCQGRVVGLSSENGSTVFELEDGRTVNILAVSQVRAAT